MMEVQNLERVDFEEPIEENEQDLEQNKTESFDYGSHEEH